MIGNTGGIYNYWNCFKVLPTVYGDSLSYYEVLCELTYTIDQVIKQLDVDNSEVYKYIDSQDNKVLATSRAYTNEQIYKVEQQLNQSLVQLITLIQTTDSSTRAWVTEQLSELENWIKKQSNSIFVINPINGKLDSLQNVLNEYYNLFNYYALTCIEYDTLGLTADEYDSMKLTAYMFDYYSKKYLWFNSELVMYHPVTGVMTSYKNVINFLIEQHREDGLTSTEYTAKNLTATQYSNANISAYDYDWKGKTLL